VPEDPAGFGAAMSGDVDWGIVTAPWVEPWAVAKVTVKNPTACGHTFVPIDAMLSLRRQYDLSLMRSNISWSRWRGRQLRWLATSIQ
jgi:2-methylcitrate dehydratase PrpD